MIYINEKGLAYLDGKYLTDHFAAKGIRCHLDTNLKDVEKDCVMSLIDLSQFDGSNVSLKCGADIGLSDVFKLIIIAVTNPSNKALNDELIGFKAHVLNKDEIYSFMKDERMLDKIKRSVEEVISKAEKIDDRIMWRSYLSTELNGIVAQLITEKREKNRLASLAKGAAKT